MIYLWCSLAAFVGFIAGAAGMFFLSRATFLKELKKVLLSKGGF